MQSSKSRIHICAPMISKCGHLKSSTISCFTCVYTGYATRMWFGGVV